MKLGVWLHASKIRRVPSDARVLDNLNSMAWNFHAGLCILSSHGFGIEIEMMVVPRSASSSSNVLRMHSAFWDTICTGPGRLLVFTKDVVWVDELECIRILACNSSNGQTKPHAFPCGMANLAAFRQQSCLGRHKIHPFHIDFHVESHDTIVWHTVYCRGGGLLVGGTFRFTCHTDFSTATDKFVYEFIQHHGGKSY